MAKYNTATQGYYQGSLSIEKFLEKEIGTKEQSDRIMKKARQATKIILKGKSEEERFALKRKLKSMYDKAAEKAKPEHHKENEQFQVYAKRLYELFESNEVIGKDTLEELIDNNETARSVSLFDNPDLKWSSETGAKAMKKFVDLVLKNDQKKLEYYKKCLKQTDKPLQLKDVLDAPTPEPRIAYKEDIEAMAVKMKALEDKLSKTDGLLHTNSVEFEAMKSALKAVNQGFAKGIDASELGSRLEALQAASMEYVKAKGVGTQVTQRGIDRMDAALDICSLAADGMDCFTSKERRAEIKDFEEKHFGKVLSTDFTDKHVKPVEEVYKEEEVAEL